ncbi:GntR family transcriptional regulator [Psychromonas sp. 14N.309.X.WAT.B.A12]|uniref:GntR family transcriptional regulator n=1 Tax=Psychromonas sp. 14N.309.X.WAT.B.A12 TaxID=2998322 RepID=UPI0025B05998|nr:GntR family transcriptional regulator [Psychromonas sp. 14N.309.X.WAT.B.A12]MDN2663273.1 GntR family transcriptional regulator [Psychromonas sp. 14N.309.X.WAT.B.A12]
MESVKLPKIQAEKIAESITNAIMEHRIAPGSKLSESRMATAFEVSRTKINQSLLMLSESGLVQQLPNRGFFVSSPSIDEAKQVFFLRQLLEPEIIKELLKNIKLKDIKRLHRHLNAEKEARASSNRRLIIRLSGEFHMLLAEMCGNRYINKMMAELCPLTCLIIALYDVPNTPACPEDEHTTIVAAIESGDEEQAISLMKHHLTHIEMALNLDGSNNNNEVDWDKIIG